MFDLCFRKTRILSLE